MIFCLTTRYNRAGAVKKLGTDKIVDFDVNINALSTPITPLKNK